MPKSAFRRANPISRDEIESWYFHGNFTCDWTSGNFPQWLTTLQPFRNKIANVIEIGSWEGRSSLFFLNYLPEAKIVCVDPFTGNAIHRNDPAMAKHLADLENIFDANVAKFEDRVEKVVSRSADALPRLAIEGRRFELAYVDGCHVATDLFTDAALLWPMIVPGGIVIFDDYGLEIDPNLNDRPKLGIDAFLRLFEGQYRLLHRGFQAVVQKTDLDPNHRK